MNVILKFAMLYILCALGSYFSYTQKTNDTISLIKVSEFEIYQDSLRQVLLGKIEIPYIKNTILEEFYIRKVLKINNDSIYWNLNFDLHGLDCCAPDCFSTSVSFQMPFSENWSFPKSIQVLEREDGCNIPKPIINLKKFQLVYNTADEVIYYCSSINRALVLVKKRAIEEGNVYAYYFNYLKTNQINIEFIDEILDRMNEATYPFTSTTLSINDYSIFLD